MKSAEVTGETITRLQLLELRRDARCGCSARTMVEWCEYTDVQVALGELVLVERWHAEAARVAARSRCATRWNSRQTGGAK